jgi:hypothetical protein
MSGDRQVSDLRPAARLPLLVLGFVALLTGTMGGLVRLEIAVPAPAAGVAWHGALMAAAFFGTLIALERAVAIGRLWAYAAPAANGAGGVALLLGATQVGVVLLVVGAGIFALASTSIWRRHPALHTLVLALGAFALFAANVALAGGATLEAVAPSWIAFFALTIGGERLELSRLMPVSRNARILFGVISVALFAAALGALVDAPTALRAAGVASLAATAWLLRHDIATRTVRAAGLTRYIALCLLAGYAWFAAGGAILLVSGGAAGGRDLWDAALHAILVGFVFSMVFGHAPVILPAVLRVTYPYHPALYVPLAVLHATLVARVAGDLIGSTGLRATGAAGNALAIALFIVTSVVLVTVGARRRRQAESGSPR